MAGDISTFYVQNSGEYYERLPLVYSVNDKANNPKE